MGSPPGTTRSREPPEGGLVLSAWDYGCSSTRSAAYEDSSGPCRLSHPAAPGSLCRGVYSGRGYRTGKRHHCCSFAGNRDTDRPGDNILIETNYAFEHRLLA